MRAPCWTAPLLVLGLAVAGPGDAAASLYEHPDFGYKTRIPPGWQHKLDVEEGILHLAAPGGFRIRVEGELSRSSIGKTEILRNYRTDGRLFQSTYGRIKVVQKPIRAQGLGKVPTIRYGFAYKPEGERLHHALAWLGASNARESGKELAVKVLAYGESQLFQEHKRALKEFLAAFLWPDATRVDPVDDGQDTPGPLVVSPTIPDTGPSPTPGGGDSGSDYAPDPDLASARSPRPGEFDRGSFSGGRGFTRFLKVNRDAEYANRIAQGMGAKDRQRDDEQRRNASARLGFDPNR